MGLGVLELLQPRRVRTVDGMTAERESHALVRIAGAHKLLIGLGLLAATRKQPWLKAALAGGAFDATALASKGGKASAIARVATLAAANAGLQALNRHEQMGGRSRRA